MEGYPLLKDTVRIKKYPSFCWVFDTNGDNGTGASPVEALLLSLCSGAYDARTIQHIYLETFRLKEVPTSVLVEKTLNKFERYLYWRPSPEDGKGRHDPLAFLYDPSHSRMVAQGRFDSPVEATLVLTHACNFRCVYCFNDSAIRCADELAADQWLRVVEELKELDVVKCTLSGGEPLLFTGVLDIVRRLHERDIAVYLCTNGSLVDDRVIGLLSELGIGNIQLSLDAADAEIHDRMSATRNMLPKVLDAMKRCGRAGIDVYVKAVTTSLNWENMEKLIDLCRDLGVKRLVLDRFDLSIAGRGDTRLFLSREQEDEMEAMVARKQRETGASMHLSAITTPRLWSCEKDTISCGALRTAVTILPWGDVTICEKLGGDPRMSAGNVRQNTLAQIWNSPRATAIVNPPMEGVGKACRNCEHLPTCRTGCYAQTLFASDNPYDVDPRCWKAEYANNPYASYR